MKRILITAAVITAAMLVITGCGKPGFPSKVKASMTELKGVFGGLNSSAAAKDYASARDSFQKIADIFSRLDDVNPPMGGKTEWNAIHGSVIDACRKGMDACDKKDDAAIKSAIDAIGGNIKKGHGIFNKKS